MNRVWGYDFVGDSRTIDVHILWLIQKVEEEEAFRPHLIQTVRGIGYRSERF